MSICTLDIGDPAVMQRLLNGLNTFPKEHQMATFRILRRVGGTVRSKLIRDVMDRYRLRRTYVDRAFSKPVVTRKPAAMKLYMRAPKSQHVTNFSGTRQTKKGVTVSILKHGGRKLVSHAFIASGRYSGKTIAFLRAGRERYPIAPVFTTGGFDFLLNKTRLARLQRETGETIARLTAHEVDFRLQRMTR